MTPDEQRLLSDLAQKIAATPAPQRDPAAEEFIRKNIGSRPDALYIMTQTVLIQNIALERAQQQIRELQQRVPQPGAQPSSGGGGSFLGQAGQGYGQQQQQPPAGQSAPAPPPQQSYGAPVLGPPPGGSSFLAGAARTAAGVAAGALAFEGVRSLFSHPGYGAGGGLGFGDAGFLGGGGRPTEEIVNNYYDSPGDSGERHSEHERGLADASYDTGSNDDNSTDDSSDDYQTQDADYDDSSNSDDSSSYDDSSNT